MTKQNPTLMVVGAGLAGAKAVEAAREAGHDGTIVLVGDERHLPYERPPLSKQVLRGEAAPETASVFQPSFYEDHDVDLRTGTAVAAIDVGGRRVELGDGGSVAFDSLIIATGAAPRTLRVPGADLDGIHLLRTVDDATALGARLQARGRVAVIGAGWIGCEVAASAAQLGCSVTLVDPGTAPLLRVLGPEIGAAFGRLHAAHGVEVLMDVGVDGFGGDGAVGHVLLADGGRIEADTVVVGIGVEPRVDLASAAGLEVADGIVVDDHLATAVPGIYAVGDVASAFHPHLGRHLRVEHWSTALNQGATAGRNAAGADEVYDRLPYFFSDQYDLGMEYVGHAGPSDRVIVRGDLDSGAFLACWVDDGGRATAAMHANTWDSIDELRRLVTDRAVVDADRFGDAGVALEELS